MNTTLSSEEKRFLHQLLTWDEKRRTMNSVLYNLFLILGGIIIVVVGFSTVQHLNDQTVLWLTVPGFLLGLLLIGLYIMGQRWNKERQLVASIIRKLQSKE